MNNAIVQFAWQVPEAGYWLTEAQSYEPVPRGPELFLVHPVPIGHHFSYREHAPLQAQSGLFKNFALLTADSESVLNFANSYGLLTDGMGVSLPSTNAMYPGEPVADWFAAIRRMRPLLSKWEALRAGKFDGEKPNWIRGQWQELQKKVNAALTDSAAPTMLWKDDGKLGLFQVPKDLLGALWFQFAQAIDNEQEYRKCAQCNTWFAISPETNRKNRRYCSNACRVKAYRIRKEEKQS